MVGVTREIDLAVIKIEAHGLPVLSIGKPGLPALDDGRPAGCRWQLGRRHEVAAGRDFSALHRRPNFVPCVLRAFGESQSADQNRPAL